MNWLLYTFVYSLQYNTQAKKKNHFYYINLEKILMIEYHNYENLIFNLYPLYIQLFFEKIIIIKKYF